MKTSITSLKDNVSFYDSSEEGLTSDLAKATAESVLLGKHFNSTHAQVVDMREKLAEKDGVVKSLLQGSCATLRPFVSILVENFPVSIIKPVSDAFRIGFTDTQVHADTSIDGIGPHFREVPRRRNVMYLLKRGRR